jgi:large subunit ribosomal protein L25
MVTITINGTPRTETGKKATKANRNEGLIPCVLYGRGDENVHFNTTFNDVRDLVYTPEFKLANIVVDGKNYECILKDIQFHPVKDNITHIDFLHLQAGRPIKVEVPLRFEGTSPGVRSGGKFLQKVRKVKIKTTPEKIVDSVVADISGMELGQSLRVRDIRSQEGVEILNPAALPIATITVPRGLKEAAK